MTMKITTTRLWSTQKACIGRFKDKPAANLATPKHCGPLFLCALDPIPLFTFPFLSFFLCFTVFSDRLSSPISLALIHFSPLFPVARWPLCTRPFVCLSVRLSSLKALYTLRSVYMRCVHGTLKKAAGAIRWQLFHIWRMDILRALSPRQKTLFHKRPSRAELSARVSFFLCLSESLAQAFRGLSSICTTAEAQPPPPPPPPPLFLFSTLPFPFTYFSLSNVPLWPPVLRLDERQFLSLDAKAYEDSPLVIRRPLLPYDPPFPWEKADNPVRVLRSCRVPELMIIPLDAAG